MMLVIKCPEGIAFSACVKEHADEDWKLEELYYQKQGCRVTEMKSVQLGECKCEGIKHDFEPYFEDMKDEIRQQA